MSQAFADLITDCMNPGITWPNIADPGLPSFAVGLFLSQMAGITYLLDFIPPDPGNLPSIPSIDIFTDAFMANLNFPWYTPEVTLGPLTIPERPGLTFCPGLGAINLAAIFIVLPFELIKLIIEKIISDLIIAIPGIPDIVDLFASLAASLGIPGIAIANLGLCVAEPLKDLLTDTLT